MSGYSEFIDKIKADKKACFPKGIKKDYKFRKKTSYELYKYIELLRQYEYFCIRRDTSKNIILSKIWSMKIKLCDRRKNKLGMLLGVEVTPGMTGKGLRICHPNVIINGNVGEFCTFHGNNVIGNKRTGESNAIPTLGKNVDVGVGAMVIGDVYIADNCTIGAGAVVTKSFFEPGTVLAGVPAKEI